MSDLSVPQAGAVQRQWLLQILLHVLADVGAFFRGAGPRSMRAMRSAAARAGRTASRASAAIAAIRMPVSHAAHVRVTRQLDRLEVQVIASVRAIECREKRTRTLLALARTSFEIGRDNAGFLAAAVDELRVEHYWQRKQARIFSAAQLACSVAGLAAMSGHAEIGRDAYLCGQQHNGKVTSVDRKIGLAAAFADVARLLDAGYDQVAWLSTAMELASGIEDGAERFGAVNFVARKMVVDRIPPCDNHVADRRFAVDVSAMAAVIATKTVPKAAVANDEFALDM